VTEIDVSLQTRRVILRSKLEPVSGDNKSTTYSQPFNKHILPWSELCYFRSQLLVSIDLIGEILIGEVGDEREQNHPLLIDVRRARSARERFGDPEPCP
jgi:hypothetical protein